MHMIAKFRVLSLHEHHHGIHEAELRPVLPKTPTTDWSTENRSEENAAFWSATPSGEAKICDKDFLALREQYPINGAVYINFFEDPEGMWRLARLTTHPGSSQVDVEFYPDGSVRGYVRMNIENPDVGEQLKGAGSRWRIEFSRAPG